MMDQKIAAMIDHTLLSQDASRASVKQLCEEAKEYGFCSVCVNPCNVSYAAELLKDSGVRVCTVVGFPLGQNTTDVKIMETIDALKAGAKEIDMVINVARLKDGEVDYVKNEIEMIRRAVPNDSILKVIIESSVLTDEEVALASKIASDAGADFVKTSTGFFGSAATTHALDIMRANIAEGVGIKASGGIRDREAALTMMEHGATRIGASKSIAIVKGN